MSLALPPQTYRRDGTVALEPACTALGAFAHQLECLWDADGLKAEDATAFPSMVSEIAQFLGDLALRACDEMLAAS